MFCVLNHLRLSSRMCHFHWRWQCHGGRGPTHSFHHSNCFSVLRKPARPRKLVPIATRGLSSREHRKMTLKMNTHIPEVTNLSHNNLQNLVSRLQIVKAIYPQAPGSPASPLACLLSGLTLGDASFCAILCEVDGLLGSPTPSCALVLPIPLHACQGPASALSVFSPSLRGALSKGSESRAWRGHGLPKPPSSGENGTGGPERPSALQCTGLPPGLPVARRPVRAADPPPESMPPTPQTAGPGAGE